MKKALLTGLAITAGFSGMANAEFIETDLNTTGDGQALLDTTTGLEWLDNSLTRGMSVNEALAANSGWRLPTQTEIYNMLTYVMPNIGDTGREDGNSDITPFVQMIDGHPAGGDDSYAYGFYVDDDSVVRMAGIYDYGLNAGYLFTKHNVYSLTTTSSSYGVWLVSEGGDTLSSRLDPNINTPKSENNTEEEQVAVSLPSTGLLLGSFIGLLGFRRNLKK